MLNKFDAFIPNDWCCKVYPPSSNIGKKVAVQALQEIKHMLGTHVHQQASSKCEIHSYATDYTLILQSDASDNYNFLVPMEAY